LYPRDASAALTRVSRRTTPLVVLLSAVTTTVGDAEALTRAGAKICAVIRWPARQMLSLARLRLDDCPTALPPLRYQTDAERKDELIRLGWRGIMAVRDALLLGGGVIDCSEYLSDGQYRLKVFERLGLPPHVGKSLPRHANCATLAGSSPSPPRQPQTSPTEDFPTLEDPARTSSPWLAEAACSTELRPDSRRVDALSLSVSQRENRTALEANHCALLAGYDAAYGMLLPGNGVRTLA
jgi:hypothetical protein